MRTGLRADPTNPFEPVTAMCMGASYRTPKPRRIPWWIEQATLLIREAAGTSIPPMLRQIAPGAYHSSSEFTLLFESPRDMIGAS
jgi:hypothetical protein